MALGRPRPMLKFVFETIWGVVDLDLRRLVARMLTRHAETVDADVLEFIRS
jgi:hypothetical protein